jgi:MFS family permease
VNSPTADRSPLQRAAGLATLLLVPSLASLAYAGLAPILTHMADELARTPDEVALVRGIVTVTGGAIAFGALASGLLAERVGTRTLLIGSLLLFALAGGVGYLLSNVIVILATRVLVGLANAAIGVAAIALLTEAVPPEKRNRWIGFYAVSSTLGGLMLIALAGKVGAIAWRYVFLLHSIAVPMALLAWLFVPSFDRPAPAAAERRHQKLPVAVLLFGLACGAMMTTLAVYLPFHFKEIGRPDPKLIATTLIAWYASSTLLSFIYGWVRRHIGVTNLFAITFLLMGVGMAGAATARSFELITLAIFLGGIGGGLAGPNIVAFAAACPPEQRALRTGWARAGLFAAPLLIQFPLEPVVRHYGGSGAMFALAAFAFAMIPVFLLNRRLLDAGE